MAKIITLYKPTRQVQTIAKQITLAWHSALEGILEAGRLLNDAHETLEPKAWLDMVNNDLPFERRTAEKLLKISSDKRLTKRTHLKYLPPRWTTLHELTYLSDSQFKNAIEARKIHPDMERKEAESLTARNKRRAQKKKPVVISKNGTKGNGSNGAQIFDIDDDYTDQLATLKSERELTNKEAMRLEDGLNKLSEEFGFTFAFAGYSSEKAAKQGMRENLANAQRRWMANNADRYNKEGKMTRDDITLLEEAIGQLEIGKYPRKQNGSYYPHDVRNPKNPYHDWYEAKRDPDVEWDPAEMYDFCEQHR